MGIFCTMETESNSIKAIQLTRTVFEQVHGNVGLLRFNIEELTATNGANGKDSKKWKVICSFFETLGSTHPSRYEVNVDLNDNTVSIKKLSQAGDQEEKQYTVTESIKEAQEIES